MHAMLLIPLIISSVVLLITLVVSRKEDVGEQIGNAFVSVITSFLVGLIIGLVVCVVVEKHHFTEPQVEESKIIYSAELSQRAHGSVTGAFTIFSGYYSNDYYYFVYVDRGSGAMRLEKFDIDTTYIKESDEKPHVDFYYRRLVNDRPRFSIIHDDHREFQYNVLVVPKGTVINRYDVNIGK